MDVLARFFENVDRSGGPDVCHPWVGPTRNAKGYGAFRVDGQTVVAHRWLLGHLRGKPLVWPGEVGCHRCDKPPCCNPAHLYVGTHRDNVLDAIERSGHPASRRFTQTHCANGHEYTPENTLISSGRRCCRQCKRAQSRETMRRRREARGIKTRSRRANGQFEWADPAVAHG